MNRTRSIDAIKEARHYIPGGVNSPVRAFGTLDGHPPFIRKAYGSSLEDIDENRYIDYNLSWGVFITGHAHPKVSVKIIEAVRNGTSYGAPTLDETEMARKIVSHLPGIEKLRLVNSGTEAVMSALRLARAHTGRDLILKFDGCYHGHTDAMLIEAGSGLTEISRSSSSGVHPAVSAQTISIPFNNVEILEETFHKVGNRLAAVITEPFPANMGLVLPERNFLKHLEDLCRTHHALLIFDEVITAYRTGLSGMQGELGITPDLTCLGKIIGGGFPLGAYGGKKEIMQQVAPEGDMYQAGTLSGNPVAVAAGLATLELLDQDLFYDTLNNTADKFGEELTSLAGQFGIRCQHFHSMFSLAFTDQDIENYEDVKSGDLGKFRKFYLSLLSKGIYLSPSAFETHFISAAHSQQELDQTLEIIQSTLKALHF